MRRIFISLIILIISVFFNSCSNVPDDKIKITVENKITEAGYIDKVYCRTSDKLIGGWELVWDESDDDYHPKYSSFYLDEEGSYQFRVTMRFFGLVPVNYYSEIFSSFDCYYGQSYRFYFDGYSLNYEQ